MFVSVIESVVSDTERLFCEVEHEEYQIFIEGDIIYTYVCLCMCGSRGGGRSNTSG